MMTLIIIVEREKNYQFDALEKIALKHYLIHAEDIRNCPNGKCKYSGFVQEGYCNRNIECKLC